MALGKMWRSMIENVPLPLTLAGLDELGFAQGQHHASHHLAVDRNIIERNDQNDIQHRVSCSRQHRHAKENLRKSLKNLRNARYHVVHKTAQIARNRPQRARR